MKTYVLTTYDANSFRKHNLTLYRSIKEAKTMVATTHAWGMGILSCQIISPRKAKALIKNGKVEYEKE